MPKKKEKVDVWKYKKYICTVKPINVYTGRKIIVLNNDEAKEHDIYLGYRTIIKYNGTKHAVLVDVSNDLIKPGEIGVYKEVMDELGIRSGSKIEIIHMNRPESLRYIKDKLDGQVLSDEAIKSIIRFNEEQIKRS